MAMEGNGLSLDLLLRLIKALLSNYLYHGWPFLLAHFLLLGFFLWSFRKVWLEVRELEVWSAERETPPRYTSARIVSQFVADTGKHGQEGSLIPLTDYSDRLDAHIDHTIAALATKANLFLVIGVMGTFFALFQFAFDVQKGLLPELIGQRLSQGLAAAFPIGFMGLILTMIAHPATDWLEGLFRAAADDAVHKGLEWRSRKLKTVESAVLEAIEPLKNLEATLSRTLQPVIESFREQLKQTHEIMARQVQPLAEVTERLNGTNEKMAAAIGQLTKSVREFGDILDKFGELQEKNLKLVTRTRKVIDEFDEQLRALSDALLKAAHRLSALPDELGTILEQELARTIAGIESAWQQSSSRFFEDLSQASGGLKSASEDLGAASGRLRQLPAGMEEEMRRFVADTNRAFAEHLGSIENRYEEATGRMVESSAQVWRDGAGLMIDSLREALISPIQSIRYASEEACKRLADAANHVTDVANGVKNSLHSLIPELLDRAASELEPRLHQLEEAARLAYPKALENLQLAVEATRRFQEAAAEANRQFEESAREILRRSEALRDMIARAAGELERAARELAAIGVRQADGDKQVPEKILAEFRAIAERLPSQVVSAFALGFEDGKPVLSVKTVPFWKRV